jgi:integrase
MKCVKCKKEIPPESVYCMFCGKKQTEKKKTRSHKGTGSVSLVNGRYQARLTINGKRKSLGCYSTKAEALEAIKKADTDLLKSDKYNATVEDIYLAWSGVHYDTISDSAETSYRNAWKHMESIKNVKMRDIKTSHFQKCINEAASQFTRSVCEKIKSLGSMLCKFAMQDDVINKNYALLVELPPNEPEETLPFTDEEIATLFQNDEDDTVKIILMMIYCGFRPTEFLTLEKSNVDLENGFIRGGSKTEAGKNRIVPIHKSVMKYYRHFMATHKDSPYLINSYWETKYQTKNWRNRKFYPTLERIGILKDKDDRHVTPYSCRHTFATLCDRAGINDNIIIKMIGHTTKKTTDRFYIHQSEEDMKQAVNEI